MFLGCIFFTQNDKNFRTHFFYVKRNLRSFSKANVRAKCIALRCFLDVFKYDASWFILLRYPKVANGMQ